jgi:hypothetical protein
MRVFLKILECSFKQEEGVKCNKPKTFVGILNGKKGERERGWCLLQSFLRKSDSRVLCLSNLS